MKLFKICIFVLSVFTGFLAFGFAGATVNFLNDSSLKPLSSDLQKNFQINNDADLISGEPNLQESQIIQELEQYVPDLGDLDENEIYIDEINHRLFVTDTANNRILVFDLTLDNVLVDYIPEYVFGQPDFNSYSPGATESKLSAPGAIAYDQVQNNLFVFDVGNNRIMVFGASSIENGQDAVNIISPDEISLINPLIASRLKNNSTGSGSNKNNFISSIVLWCIISLLIIVFVVVIIFYVVKRKKQ